MSQFRCDKFVRLTLALATFATFAARAGAAPEPPYQPTWNSLKHWRTPQWLRDGKFGIYTHWGVYSVPAQGPNGTWYANHLYTDPNGPERKYHEATYGPLEKFGYKEFIPMFTGEKFNADEWADLFQRAGARFAGPVAEHHDGFSMWDTKYSEWNAAKMGPKRDVVGELAKAMKKRNMKFVTAFHHAENWFYFPTWDKRYDCGDPQYSGLYGPIHEKGAVPTKAFLDRWEGKIKEVIDKYDPDFIWFDFGLELIPDYYKEDMLAYFFNHAAARKKEVVVSYKWTDLPPGAGLLDLEVGQYLDLTYHEWITDTSIDAGQGWGYVKDLGFKTVDNLVDNLVDRVSKNGYLLLNVGPKPDGTIPDEAKERLLGLGKWLRVNGEAIYGTTCWSVAGEGPTRLAKSGDFNEQNDLRYTGKDFRFTVKDNNLYAIALDWPGEKALIKSLAPKGQTFSDGYSPGLYPSEIVSITMLGDGKELKWEMTKEGLSIETPKARPCDCAFVFKIARRKPF
ncbi:MAG: alpha-L-fucosidase [Verrucomicrobiota bacterium]|jgi:alpha-L-fucosidase